MEQNSHAELLASTSPPNDLLRACTSLEKQTLGRRQNREKKVRRVSQGALLSVYGAWHRQKQGLIPSQKNSVLRLKRRKIDPYLPCRTRSTTATMLGFFEVNGAAREASPVLTYKERSRSTVHRAEHKQGSLTYEQHGLRKRVGRKRMERTVEYFDEKEKIRKQLIPCK